MEEEKRNSNYERGKRKQSKDSRKIAEYLEKDQSARIQTKLTTSMKIRKRTGSSLLLMWGGLKEKENLRTQKELAEKKESEHHN